MSTSKLKALIGKEWDPISCNGDVWGDLDEARVTELLNSEKSFVPVGESSPPSTEAPSFSPVEEVTPLSPVVTNLALPLRQPGKTMLVFLRNHPHYS